MKKIELFQEYTEKYLVNAVNKFLAVGNKKIIDIRYEYFHIAASKDNNDYDIYSVLIFYEE